MTCPECSAPVRRAAFFSASGLSGVTCETCGQKLAATYESRFRLTGGGIVLGMVMGGLTRRLGADSSAFLVSAAAFAVWMLVRTDKLLRLERVATSGLDIRRPE